MLSGEVEIEVETAAKESSEQARSSLQRILLVRAYQPGCRRQAENSLFIALD
jgi:hypothetical protein